MADKSDWTIGETPEAPNLVFDMSEEEESTVNINGVSEKQDTVEKEARLTPEEEKQVNDFAAQIDIENTRAIMNYGIGTQKKIADLADKAIGNTRTKDTGEVGDMITSLVTELKNFDVDDEEKGLFAFFKKSANKMNTLKVRYARVEANVTTISDELEKHQVTLLKDIDILERMYTSNLTYLKEMTMYIMAGRKKLDEVKNGDLAELQAKAQRTGKMEDIQKAKDLASLCERFEKKLYDLDISRTVAMQTVPQIRMLQASDSLMAEKIQSTIVNTIPIWKNQMVIAIGVEHSSQAARAERQVNDMTNELLKKNAERLKMATVNAAKESERGIVDIETLKHTNEQLISTLDELMAVQKEGKAKREEAQKELLGIENQLKEKLMQASKA